MEEQQVGQILEAVAAEWGLPVRLRYLVKMEGRV
jgi:hypothetical protein